MSQIKNLVYICFFNKVCKKNDISLKLTKQIINASQKNTKKYLVDKDLIILNLFFESIQLFCSFEDPNTDFLIYTTTSLRKQIMELHSVQLLKKYKNIFYHINNNKEFDSTLAKFDIFDLIDKKKYSRFLYLDNNILVVNNLETIFNLITDDIIYANTAIDYENQIKYNPEILLFNNSDTIQSFFDKMRNDEIPKETCIITTVDKKLNFKRNSFTNFLGYGKNVNEPDINKMIIDADKLERFIVSITPPSSSTRSSTVLSALIPDNICNCDIITFIKVNFGIANQNKISTINLLLKHLKKKKMGIEIFKISKLIKAKIFITLVIVACIVTIVITLIIVLK